MVYSYISGMSVIEKISDLRLETQDWIPSAPSWIYEGLRKLKCRSACVQAEPLVIPVINNRFKLPQWLFSISAITTLSGDRFVIDRSVVICNSNYIEPETRTLVTATIVNPDKPIYKIGSYDRNLIAVVGLNTIDINIDVDNIILYYRRYPSHNVSTLQQEVPIIPDTENTITALFFYVLSQILLQGTVHSIYTLRNQNQLYDPMVQWERFRLIAHREINAFDDSDLEIISQALTTMFYDKDYFYKGGFKA